MCSKYNHNIILELRINTTTTDVRVLNHEWNENPLFRQLMVVKHWRDPADQRVVREMFYHEMEVCAKSNYKRDSERSKEIF